MHPTICLYPCSCACALPFQPSVPRRAPCRWWWRSFLCGGSTGIFIYGYCFYYYHARSDMNGFMQTSFFFGYNAVVCYAFFLMLGTVGFRASLLFVKHIYRCGGLLWRAVKSVGSRACGARTCVLLQCCVSSASERGGFTFLGRRRASAASCS